MSRIQDVSETLAIFERQLNDGSSLEYHLQVLQQPERARACGQGAKCMFLFFFSRSRPWRRAHVRLTFAVQPMQTVDRSILRL